MAAGAGSDAGSLVTGYLLWRIFPFARGSGIPQTKSALFIEEGEYRCDGARQIPLLLDLAGDGIALGREGPSVQVGAGSPRYWRGVSASRSR